MKEIDGSMLEGGGQILRTAVALSALTGIPIRISNVRSKRSPPGLRMQHITAIKSVAALVEADVKGLNVSSSVLTFTPKEIKFGEFVFDVGTAGSVTLVLQALMPVAAYASGKISVEVRGGTNNQMAPPIEYTHNVLLPSLKRMAFEGSVTLVRRGFYPRGGGIVKTVLNPVKALNPFSPPENCEILRIWGISYSCRLPDHITQRMANRAQTILGKAGYTNVNMKIESLKPGDNACSIDPGCGIFLAGEFIEGFKIGFDALGELGKSAENVGEEAALGFLDQLKFRTCIDKYLSDQLMIWLSLAEGSSRIKVRKLTLHALTSMEVCRLILGSDFKVAGELGKPSIITCEGIGLTNKFF